ncbi:MAG: dicarboxylate/amino acid:cation symporter [Bacteroidales bacterium]|nr:dicarboxylate/amino acid:cation symporter [Bacteroidales bacterium]
MKKQKFPLYLQILLALILGVLFGIFLPEKVEYVSWMGEIFMRALKMIIIPLILTSIISGVANIGGTDNLGRLGLRTIGYYMLTSLLAIVTGLFFVNIFKPGVGFDLKSTEPIQDIAVSDNPFMDTLMNIVPTNIFQAFNESNMLSIIFFALLFGFFITTIRKDYSKLLVDFFNASFEAMMKLTQFIIKFTPFGIFGIIAKVVSEQDNLGELAGRLGIYMLVVLAGLFFHAFITLPTLVRTIGRVNPIKHFRLMVSTLLTAFSTSSSGATLSLTMDTVKNKVGVSNKIASFTLPLGATINMDGTALYELVVAMFIAQAYGIELTITQQFIAVFTALLASIGAAGIPMAGLVMISVILSTLGLPLEGLGLVIAVDRILDMFRTAVNVWSDSCAAVIIAKKEGETLLIENEKTLNKV